MGNRAAWIAVAALLVGCANQPPVPEPIGESELLIALKSTDRQWLQGCETLGELPNNNTGNLLQDYNNVAEAGTCWRAKYEGLVNHVGPIIERAKATTK